MDKSGAVGVRDFVILVFSSGKLRRRCKQRYGREIQ